MPPRVIRAADVADAALPLCVASLQEAVDSVGTATFVLSGGSTPLALYGLLAGADLDWSRIHVFWGDERFVPHDDPASNYGVARRAFLDALDIPEGNVHPWPILETAEASAEAYSDILQSLLGLDFSFTLTLLGLGSDRHTASLFPGTGTVHARGLTVASRPPAAAEPRLSLTVEALNRSRTTLFLVSGAGKQAALDDLLATPAPDSGEHPARAISATRDLFVVTDLPAPS